MLGRSSFPKAVSVGGFGKGAEAADGVLPPGVGLKSGIESYPILVSIGSGRLCGKQDRSSSLPNAARTSRLWERRGQREEVRRAAPGNGDCSHQSGMNFPPIQSRNESQLVRPNKNVVCLNMALASARKRIIISASEIY